MLNITAYDSGEPRLASSNTFLLFITVTDTNDNRPQFDRSEYKITVLENEAIGTEILKFTVRDLDEGVNSQLDVSIQEKSFAEIFEIRQHRYQEYKMILLQELNYEDKSLYSFTIKAQDGGVPQLESSTMVSLFLFLNSIFQTFRVSMQIKVPIILSNSARLDLKAFDSKLTHVLWVTKLSLKKKSFKGVVYKCHNYFYSIHNNKNN